MQSFPSTEARSSSPSSPCGAEELRAPRRRPNLCHATAPETRLRNSPSVNLCGPGVVSFDVALRSSSASFRPLCCGRATSSVVQGTQRRWFLVALTKLKAVLLAGATTVGLVAVAVPGSVGDCRALAASGVNWSTVTHLTKSGPDLDGGARCRCREGGSPQRDHPTRPTGRTTGRSSRPSPKTYHITDQLGEPRGLEPGRAQRDQGRRRPFRRPGRA